MRELARTRFWDKCARERVGAVSESLGQYSSSRILENSDGGGQGAHHAFALGMWSLKTTRLSAGGVLSGLWDSVGNSGYERVPGRKREPSCMQHKRNATTNNDTGTSAPTWLGGIGGPELELEPVALLDRTSGCVPLYPRMAQCSGTIDTSAASEASTPATCRARRSLEALHTCLLISTPTRGQPLPPAPSYHLLLLAVPAALAP